MNRTDRLLAIVLELRVSVSCRAEDLARAFGTSKRTIYRDIQALSEAGIPIVSMMGQGYQLAEGYFLPPLAFTEDEATLILLGLGAVENSFDAEYRTSVQSARRKIVGVLSATTRERAESLQTSLLLGNLMPIPAHELDSLRVLRRAIVMRQTIRFRYFTRHPGDGTVSLRDVDPYTLACFDGVWYLSGFCHLRQDRRLFRLSRMEAFRLTGRTFDRPGRYTLADHAARYDRNLMVQLIIDEEALMWINEDRSYYIHSRVPHPDGVLVTLYVRHIDEIIQWALGWGRHVRVLEPMELRERLVAEAEALRKNHAES